METKQQGRGVGDTEKVLTVPMRNGNRFSTVLSTFEASVLTVPMRNGNT